MKFQWENNYHPIQNWGWWIGYAAILCLMYTSSHLLWLIAVLRSLTMICQRTFGPVTVKSDVLALFGEDWPSKFRHRKENGWWQQWWWWWQRWMKMDIEIGTNWWGWWGWWDEWGCWWCNVFNCTIATWPWALEGERYVLAPSWSCWALRNKGSTAALDVLDIDMFGHGSCWCLRVDNEKPTIHCIQILKTGKNGSLLQRFPQHFGELWKRTIHLSRFAAGPCHYLLRNRSGSTGGTVIGLGGA